MLKHIVLIGIVLCCILHGSWVFTSCIDDHCTDAVFCDRYTTKAHPTDCHRYYICNYGNWLERQCAPGTDFDTVGCICNYREHVTCNWCDDTVTKVPISPGLCDNVPEPCMEGDRYPDRSDCQSYYECQLGVPVRLQCGYMVHKCKDVGTACAFDVYTLQCIVPNASFDCDNRCLMKAQYVPTVEASTKMELTSVEPQSTESWTTTEEPSTANPDENGNSCPSVFVAWALVIVLILIIILLSCRLYRIKPVKTVPNSNKVTISSLNQLPSPPPKRTLDKMDESKTVRKQNDYSNSNRMDDKDSYQRLNAQPRTPVGGYDTLSPQAKSPPPSRSDQASQPNSVTVIVNPTYKMVGNEDKSGRELDDEYLSPVYDKITEPYSTLDHRV